MGEPAGFREFVAARSRPLLRTGWLLTGDWQLAQDLVQTALERTWRRWERIERVDNPEVYVRRVMVNTWSSWWRRRRHDPVLTGAVPETADGTSRADGVDTQLVVQRVLSGLPRGQRAVLVLRFYDDLTEAQTAQVLGCSVGTVKSQTARALARLRELPEVAALTGREMPR